MLKEKQKKKNINTIRRKNAKLYPIYKMFSWDLLFFYSIEFLFYTITKHITPSDVLIINGIYLMSKIICQIPAVAITDFIGKKKSIVFGNILIIIFMLLLINSPNAIFIAISYFICALGYDIKLIAESNLLYDSVATKGGDGLYSKLDAKGGSLYYLLDGMASLIAGYLFVINNYLPMFICLGFLIISTIISFGFTDIYEVKEKKYKKSNMLNVFKEYGSDLKQSFKFILRSNRMKAFVIFQMIFYSLIKTIAIFQSDLLVEIGIKEEQFSMIFAVLTLISGISISLKKSFEDKLKNRTLAFLSLTYILACIGIGIITEKFTGNIVISIVLVLLAIQHTSSALWYILEAKYLRNFTKENVRNKIIFSYEFIGAIAASIFSIISGLLLNVFTIERAFLVVGLFSLSSIIIALDYMKTRFGLKPNEYKKEDIEFDIEE